MPFEREAEVLPLHCIFAVKPGSPDHVGTKCAGLFPPALEAEEAPALQPWASTPPPLGFTVAPDRRTQQLPLPASVTVSSKTAYYMTSICVLTITGSETSQTIRLKHSSCGGGDRGSHFSKTMLLKV